MVETKSIAELSDLAKQLNSQSNSLNRYITALNEQLAPLNLGLEFWYEPPLAYTGVRLDSSVSPLRKFSVATFLGYCELEDKWQLAIKETTTDYQWNAEYNEEDTVEEDDYTPLLKASREIRLEATEKFDEFLTGLIAHTKAQLAKIQRAEKAAKLK